MLSTSTISKMKFPHDTTQIIYFNTFSLQDELLYVIQCNSKNLYIGNALYDFVLHSQHTIPEQITSVCACYSKSKIYFGTNDGKIYYLCQNQQKQLKTLPSQEGHSIISMNVFQGEHDQLFVFEGKNIIKWYRDETLHQNIKIDGEFKMIETVKNCQGANDAFVMIYFIEEKGYPYILNQKNMEQMFQNSNPMKLFHQYDQSIIYNEDEFIPHEVIDAICLDPEGNIVIIATKTNRIVFLKVIEENHILHIMPMFMIYEQEMVISMDFFRGKMVYLIESGIVAYDEVTRKRIGKKLRFTGENNYQWVKWTADEIGIMYGTRKSARSKLYVRQLIHD